MKIGLTGGIGSGKSSVAALLAKRGIQVVDADAIAREVVEPGSSGLAALVEQFGSGIQQADGSLNRAALAEIAFSSTAATAALNAITHPLIVERTSQLFALAPEGSVVVHDIALLTELGLGDNYDLVVVVDCPDEVRIARLVNRGLTAQDARARIEAQATREDRLAIADVVVDNSGSWRSLELQVDELFERIEREAANNAS